VTGWDSIGWRRIVPQGLAKDRVRDGRPDGPPWRSRGLRSVDDPPSYERFAWSHFLSTWSLSDDDPVGHGGPYPATKWRSRSGQFRSGPWHPHPHPHPRVSEQAVRHGWGVRSAFSGRLTPGGRGDRSGNPPVPLTTRRTDVDSPSKKSGAGEAVSGQPPGCVAQERIGEFVGTRRRKGVLLLLRRPAASNLI
jgi:hypothetical protein